MHELAGSAQPCSLLVPGGPGYDTAPLSSQICNIIGATPNSSVVGGTRSLAEAFDFCPSHIWRNFSMLLAFNSRAS